MTFNEIMNSPLLYGLVGAGIVYILIFCGLTFRKAYKHGLEIGLTEEKLKSVIVSSAIYSIVPSVSIVVGLFSLATVIGVPWSWFRLSVVGAVAYEVTAADMAATGAGYESIAALNAAGDTSIIGTLMFVMSIGIMGGMIGVIVGIGLSRVISKMADIPVGISVPAIIVSVLFSMLIGVIFGLLPSVKASNLNPIDALRHE